MSVREPSPNRPAEESPVPNAPDSAVIEGAHSPQHQDTQTMDGDAVRKLPEELKHIDRPATQG